MLGAIVAAVAEVRCCLHSNPLLGSLQVLLQRALP